MAELIMKDEVFAVVGAAIEVHRELGHGFLEAVYQEALPYEFEDRAVPHRVQPDLAIRYKKRRLKEKYIPDFICFGEVVVEIKAMKSLTEVEEAQLLNYLRATGMPVGVLINFGSRGKLEWKRMALTER
ncbi:MAG: GxxExxY protein [Planctomycetes bacterium]|nr:GxxExxY protein [Planctomycetota bacterium]MCW8136330.1 GxxExxY protein [Planctomycetota bacterium]